MTHGHTGLQTFPRIINSLLWGARQGETILQEKITTCVVCFFLSSVYNFADHFFSGGNYDYRSPQEFYPHMHWLLKSTQGVEEKCICKHCNHPTNQRDINKIFWLPPHKESPKGPTGPKKNKKTRKLQAPRGVTSQRGMVMNRNSITTGPVATLGYEGQMQKAIGFKTSHPFRP